MFLQEISFPHMASSDPVRVVSRSRGAGRVIHLSSDGMTWASPQSDALTTDLGELTPTNVVGAPD